MHYGGGGIIGMPLIGQGERRYTERNTVLSELACMAMLLESYYQDGDSHLVA